MKFPLICVLLALLPLSTLRMVCLDQRAAGLTAAPAAAVAADDASAAAAAEEDDECTRVCLRRAPVAPPATQPVVSCVLVADPSCEFLTTGFIAVIPHRITLAAEPAARRYETGAVAAYLPPSPSLRTPPPKL